MTIRALTIKEMYELPIGSRVVLTETGADYVRFEHGLEAGAEAFRRASYHDDYSSVGFQFTPGKDANWEFFSDGEVGIEETQAPKERTLFEGMNFSKDTEFASGDLLTIQKPLTERKVGKIQIHLFDQGFPNAILEVAKVMTWAGENKGYLPHDWKNLPSPESTLQGAGSRHRVASLIQMCNDVAPIDRTDDESKLLHKAHEAFNVLAELELILTGRI